MQTIGLENVIYPRLLKQIPDPPGKIYVDGSLFQDELCFAIVGTRKPSSYGIEAAKYFARSLAEAGFTIVSGLALGIDAVSHQEALNCGKRTIAVLGSGVENITPLTNRHLGQQIIENGAIVSEFPGNYPAMKQNFRQRDRLISGLAHGVLVIEAPERSGTSITASAALEQGREVFAVPGEIFSRNSIGTNKLIQQGAKLVCSVDDILEEFLGIPEIVEMVKKQKNLFEKDVINEKILTYFDEPRTQEELCELTGLSISEVGSKLTILELKNILKRRQDGRFFRT